MGMQISRLTNKIEKKMDLTKSESDNEIKMCFPLLPTFKPSIFLFLCVVYLLLNGKKGFASLAVVY